MKKIPLLLLATFSSFSLAAKGPIHKSLRAYSMGNAFVAVVDDKDAVYYNPAGLNMLNRLGNYEKDPELGYYVHNMFDARFSLGLDVPVDEARAAYDLGRDFQSLYNNANQDTKESPTGENGLIDSLGQHPELADRLNQFDRLPINIGTKLDMELAMPHFGGAIWMDGAFAPYIEGGVITPAAGLDTAYMDLVAQAAVGWSIGERWSVGVGYKMAQRAYLNEEQVSILEYEESQDSVLEQIDRERSNVQDISTIGHAVEFGALYQWKREVRLGASVRNIFIRPLREEEITPNLTAGIAYSPRRLQRNTGFYRKVNFAADFEDMLNNDRNYKFFSHLNFGVEVDQVLLGIPNWPSLRILKVRGGVGFKGGYPTAGAAIEVLRIAEVEVCTWAEEAGYFTGAEENRYWIAQLSFGL